MSDQGWIGVDLDGTLFVYTHGDYNAFVVGPPIPKMVDRVKQWLKEGKTVKIMTARANPATETPERLEKCLKVIEAACTEQFGHPLPITWEKDYHMYVLYDDRAKQVEMNTGILIEDQLEEAQIEAWWLRGEVEELRSQLMRYSG